MTTAAADDTRQINPRDTARNESTAMKKKRRWCRVSRGHSVHRRDQRSTAQRLRWKINRWRGGEGVRRRYGVRDHLRVLRRQGRAAKRQRVDRESSIDKKKIYIWSGETKRHWESGRLSSQRLATVKEKGRNFSLAECILRDRCFCIQI